MNAFHKGLTAFAIAVATGVVLVAVLSMDRRGRNEAPERPSQVVGITNPELNCTQATDDHAAASVGLERVTFGPGTSRVVGTGGAVASAPVERVAYFTVFDQAEFGKRSAELGTVGDLACQGDPTSIGTLVAVADSGTSLSGEAVRMLGRVPAKPPEVVERLIRYAQTPDFRIASAALEILPQIATESSALAVVSNVLALCHDREYGSTNKVGPVCIYGGRNSIREACISALAKFRSPESLAVVEHELGVLARTPEKENGQREYGARLAALLADMRSVRPVSAAP